MRQVMRVGMRKDVKRDAVRRLWRRTTISGLVIRHANIRVTKPFKATASSHGLITNICHCIKGKKKQADQGTQLVHTNTLRPIPTPLSIQ
jgi:hypothetical protein